MCQAEAERDRLAIEGHERQRCSRRCDAESATAVSLLRCFVFIQGRQKRGHRSIGGACLILAKQSEQRLVRGCGSRPAARRSRLGRTRAAFGRRVLAEHCKYPFLCHFRRSRTAGGGAGRLQQEIAAVDARLYPNSTSHLRLRPPHRPCCSPGRIAGMHLRPHRPQRFRHRDWRGSRTVRTIAPRHHRRRGAGLVQRPHKPSQVTSRRGRASSRAAPARARGRTSRSPGR